MCPIAIIVFSYSFQIAGAVILLLWSFRSCDKKIKEMCISEFGSIPIGKEDKFGMHFTLDRKSLRRNAKNVYLNIAAFFNIIAGYMFAIFVQPVDYSPGLVVLTVAVVTVGLLVLELFIVILVANCVYRKDFETCDNQCAPKKNTIFFVESNDKPGKNK